ncbi:hypothetical protein GDO78_022977, partial [Eleutherodactylus coqui]
MTILAAIFLKWKPLRSLQTCYKILSCLSLSRCLYLLSCIFFYAILVFHPWVRLDMAFATAMLAGIMFLYCSNLWFAAVLCVFYCVKITSYNNKFWIFLKMKICRRVSWFLLASLLISVSSTLPFSFYVYALESHNLFNSTMENAAIHNKGLIINIQKQLLMFLVGSCPPFLICCITICWLLHSLWMHTRHMRSSVSGFRAPNLQSHFSAVKSMSLFLVLQIINFILPNVQLSGKLYYKILEWVLPIIICSSIFVHSLYIIFSNSDLKKTCLSMLHTI